MKGLVGSGGSSNEVSERVVVRVNGTLGVLKVTWRFRRFVTTSLVDLHRESQ